MPVVNMQGVQTEFTPVPHDLYDARFTDFKNGVGKTSGQPKVTLIFTITDGDFEGRRIFTDCSLQPHALFALKRAMLAMGSDADDLETSFDTDELLEDLKGSRVRLNISVKDTPTDTNPDKQSNSVDEILAY